MFGRAEPLTLPIAIPREKQGFSHPLGQGSPIVSNRGVLASGVTVKLDNRFVKLDASAFITKLEGNREEAMATLSGQCAEAQVRVASVDLKRRAPHDYDGISLYGTGGMGEVPAETPIHWSDGKVAGRTLRAGRVPQPEGTGAARHCWHPPSLASGVNLCVPSDKVVAYKTGEGTIGLGNTGLIGKGGGGGTGSGYGRGSGAGFGGRGKRVPRVRQAKATVKGDLDKDIIRRIVRAHINEVRHCYNQGLVRDKNLKGRVAIEFVINANGKVGKSEVASQSVTKPVANCIAKAVKRWLFPKPKGGGKVTVVYPFVLEPG